MDIIDLRYYLKRYENYCKSKCSDILNGSRYPASINKKDQPVLKKLYFEVTNICNSRCVFCAYRKISEGSEYKKGVMIFDVFKKAIDDYVAMGGKTVSLTPTIGETLLDPGILEKIDYAVGSAKMKKVYFYTNGILLNRDQLYKKLIDSGVRQIGISSPGFERQLFNNVFGVAFYDEMLVGVRSLLEYNKKLGEPVEIRINFRSPLMPSQVLKTPDFRQFVEPFFSSKKVGYTFLVDYDNWGGTVTQADLSGVMRLKRSFSVQRRPCLRTFEASVLHDGKIRLCGCRVKETEFDELVVGDITKNSLREIYYGERAERIRKMFLSGDAPPVCRNCSLYDPGNFDYPNYI